MTLRLGALLLLGAALPAAAADPEHRQLAIGVAQFPSNLHPAIENMVANEYVLGFVQRRLTLFDYDWKLACQLCTEVPTVENGRVKAVTLADGRPGRAVTFELRPDAKWGDGKPVSTRDVLFSWEFGRDPTSGVANYNLYTRDIVAIDVKDERTFTITRSQTLCNPAEFIDFRLLPEHVERKRWLDNKVEYRTRNGYDANPTDPALYNGPYRIASLERGANIVLERNPFWAGQKPVFDRIAIKSIENTAALEANLKAGDIDFIAGENGIQFDQAVAFQKRNKDRFDIEFKSQLMHEYIVVNQDDPWLKDLRLRQALMYAMDRTAISKQIFEGQQSVADTSIHPLDSPHTDEGVVKYALDKAKAVQLLIEAGWATVGPDGVRRNAAGERLSMELGTTAGNKTRELVQQVLQRMWRDVGIEVRLKTQPARVVFGETLRKRQFPHMYMVAFSVSPLTIPEQTQHSRSVSSEANGWAGNNYGGYRNAELDRAIDDLQVKCEAADQKQAWTALQQTYARDLPQLPLYFRVNTSVTPKWLRNVRQTGHQFAASWWVETWNVEKTP